MNIENVVNTCELLIDQIDGFSTELQELLFVGFGTVRHYNAATTVAHCRVHYYIERLSCSLLDSQSASRAHSGFNKLAFLLLDARSGFHQLSPEEQAALLQKNDDVIDSCFVFD